MSHHLKCSFCDKNFSSISLTIAEIQNGQKKRGATLNNKWCDSILDTLKKNRVLTKPTKMVL